ncbi:hypothetical protein [Parasphingorhabdus cellanae]|uniref:17 kDa surface antigen n=1 Tax=Parasphingorhabdus cellanae TaxID=2806553 RepID=A0ABX7T9Z0_9SPHN|nr:hypothetical protein [Parasphingorhabdus cellanae]QTD56953.1 hypothetical protein J4G78_05130 [Parasphingorhabdus cellanae]
MNTLKTAMIGTAAATAMAVSATPAMAKDHDRDGISAGEVIAGAVVLGGLAAILSSNKKDRYYSGYDRDYRDGRYRDGHYRDRRYGKRIRPRRAVNKCVRAAERKASYYGRADVTQIRDVKRTSYGYKVKGRIVVKDGYRGYRRSYDRGKFTCYVEGRRVSGVRLKDLRHRY